MIELVFVIAIVGILSAVLTPNFQRDTLMEAANQLVSHIRYTQHLAMMDNKFDPKSEFWFKDRWQMQFVENVNGDKFWSYTIYCDSLNHNKNPNIGDLLASDPLNPINRSASGAYVRGTILSGGFSNTIKETHKGINKKMALTKQYGIQSVQFSSTCSYYKSKRILFDSLGRPYYNYKNKSNAAKNPYRDMRILKKQCQVSLCLNESAGKCDYSDKDSYIKIAIEPETGYTHIL